MTRARNVWHLLKSLEAINVKTSQHGQLPLSKSSKRTRSGKMTAARE
jgi:hypothetical protein